MSDKSIEEQVISKLIEARKLARYMSSTQDLVEEQINKAQERGDFDNLQGAGKPIHFEENPFEPPELRMVLKILKDNDFVPYWIDLGKQVDADLQKFWDEVEYFKKYARLFCREKHNRQALERFNRKKAHFYYEQRLAMENINKKITDYNLHCPTFRLGRANLKVDDEMYKVISQVEQVIEDALQGKRSE